MCNLLVVTVVEGAVSDAKISFQIMSVRVLSIALKDCKCCNKVTLLQEVSNIWEFIFLLLYQNQTLD